MTQHKHHRCRGIIDSSHTPGNLGNGATMIRFLSQSKDAFCGRNARCRGGSPHKVNAKSRFGSMTMTLRKNGSATLSKLYNRLDAGQLPKSGSRRSIPRRSASFKHAHTSTLTSNSNQLIHTMVAFLSTSEQTQIALDHPTGRSSRSNKMRKDTS